MVGWTAQEISHAGAPAASMYSHQQPPPGRFHPTTAGQSRSAAKVGTGVALALGSLFASCVEHPADRPDLFVAQGPLGAWPFGQSCDWTCSLADGSRAHAQCFVVNGADVIRIHIDRWDPQRSPLHWVLHGLLETPVGPALAVGAVATGLIVAALKNDD